MQNYEMVFITPLDTKEDDLNKVLDKIKDTVSKSGGELIKLDKWGERELAYPINDLTKGIYYIAEYKAGPEVTADIEHSFRFLRNEILRFLTVKIKENKPKKIQTGKNDSSGFTSPQNNLDQGGAE